jgi:hypothetical protein
MGTLWAEIYSVQHLGAVRGLVFGLIVVVSAITPPIFGVLYGLGVTVEVIAFYSAGYCLFGSVLLAWLFFPGRPASKPGG